MKAAKIGVILAGGVAMLLGGCDTKSVTAENASTAEVAKKVRESGVADEITINPGQWVVTTTVEDMSIPGLPPEVAAKMKENTGKPRSLTTCVTPEQAKRPKEEFFAGDMGGQCRYNHFKMGGGRIDMDMTCAAQGMSNSIKMTGTYGTDAYAMKMDSSSKGGANGAGAMSMKAMINAKRTGACTGKETPLNKAG